MSHLELAQGSALNNGQRSHVRPFVQSNALCYLGTYIVCQLAHCSLLSTASEDIMDQGFPSGLIRSSRKNATSQYQKAIMATSASRAYNHE